MAQAIEGTEEKLKTLKKASEQAAASVKNYDAWKKAYTPIQNEIDETRKKVTELKSKMSEMKDMGEIDTQEYKELQAELSSSTKKLKELRQAAKEVDNEFGKPISPEKYDALQREVISTEIEFKSLKNEAKKTADSMKSSASEIATSFDKAGDSVESLGSKLDAGNLMEATDQLSAVGGALKDFGAAAIEAGSEWSNSQADIQANLGLTAQEAEELKNTAQDVFENGIADSVDTAAEAVILCKQNFGDLNNADLTKLTNQLVGISERTGTDLQENVRGASQLMGAFGIDGQQALDLIAAGYQANLNSSGDFMDTLNEYSPLFEEAGFSAEQMLSVLSAGMEGGALNTDKVADAVKELQIRMGDGTFEENIGKFSQNTKNLFQDWKNGEATVAEVSASIGEDLKQMTPTEQQEALSALSSQFEDLGVDASVALLSASDSFSDATGKAKEFSEASPGEEWQGSLNSIKDSLADVGTKIMETLQPVIDVISKLADWFSKLPGPIQTFIVIFGGLVIVFTTLAPVVMAAATAFGALNISLLPIIAIIALIAAAIVAVIAIIQNWGAITEWLAGIWDAIKAKASEIWDAIKNKISEVWESIKTAVTEKVNAVKETVTNIWNTIKSTISNVVTSIKDKAINSFVAVKDGIKNALSKVTSVVKNGFQGAIDFITSLPKKALEWGKDFIQGLINGIKNKIGKLVDTVKGIGKKIASFLHFSRPDEGPLREYEKWMPDFMEGLAKGIYNNEQIVSNAAKSVAQGIAGNMTPYISEVPQGFDYNQMYQAMKAASKETQFAIYLDSRQLGRGLQGMGVQFK